MKAFFFLVGAVAALDCSVESFLERTPNNGGTRVIYDKRLYQAQWSVSQIPGADSGWLDLGECEQMPPMPECWPAYQAIAYASPMTRVSINSENWANQWWAGANEKPVSSSTNWLRMHPCGGNPGVNPTTPPVTITTTAATSSTSTSAAPTTATSTSPAETTAKSTAATTESTTESTSATTAAATTTTSKPATTTTSAGPGEAQHRPQGPVGSAGECVWPAWDSSKAYGDSFRYFVTHKNGVYSKSYYCDAGLEPGVSPCWKPKVADCTGEPPRVKLTAAELAAKVGPNGPKYQLFFDNWDPTSPTDAELAIDYMGQTSLFNADQKRVIKALQPLDTDSIEAITEGAASNPENVKRVERIITRAVFNQLFPVRHTAYTYENLLKGVGAFPAYCQTYSDGRDSDKICLNLLITSFAHNTQEVGGNNPSLTYKNAEHMVDGGLHYHNESDAYFSEGQSIPTWKQALWYLREMSYSEESPANSPYRKCEPDSQETMMWALNYQCPAGKDYFGRGSKQLSHNYNYGLFSKLFFGDASYLLTNPHLVADSWLNFASGIWFAITPQSPKPSMLDVLDGSWVPNEVDVAAGIQAGFGATINIINGGNECTGRPVSQEVQNRINAYKNFASFFDYTIPAGEQLDCQSQQEFKEGGSGDQKMYWGPSWSCSYLCDAVPYQTAFITSVAADYQACVSYYWRARWVDRDTKTVIGQYGNLGDARPPV